VHQLRFILGLARSGSTSLSPLLARAPQFAGTWGAHAGLIDAPLSAMSGRGECAVFHDENKHQRRAAFARSDAGIGARPSTSARTVAAPRRSAIERAGGRHCTSSD
jgi:hypothetical protein